MTGWGCRHAGRATKAAALLELYTTRLCDVQMTTKAWGKWSGLSLRFKPLPRSWARLKDQTAADHLLRFIHLANGVAQCRGWQHIAERDFVSLTTPRML